MASRWLGEWLGDWLGGWVPAAESAPIVHYQPVVIEVEVQRRVALRVGLDDGARLAVALQRRVTLPVEMVEEP